MNWFAADKNTGVMPDFASPSWPIPHGYKYMMFGKPDPIVQANYIRSNPGKKFDLIVSGDSKKWLLNLHLFADLENVKGLGGRGIPHDMFAIWDLHHAFLGDDCVGFDATKFKNLKSLAGEFPRGDRRGIQNHPSLSILQPAFSPQAKAELGDLGSIPNLKHFGSSYGGYRDISFLDGLQGRLKTLKLERATQFNSLKGISNFSELRHVWIEDAKSFESWDELLDLPKLKCLYLKARKRNENTKLEKKLIECGVDAMIR